MTAHKHFKQRVRARMEKTGESYSSARRILLARLPRNDDPHFSGCVPGATALRVLLTHAGVRAPHTGEPLTEALTFGLAGGVGIGMFSFFYEKEGFASLFLAGRHLWHDHTQYLTAACRRLGLEPSVREASGVKTAEKALREALAEGPCVAWVDAALLPHRGVPGNLGGNLYHVVTVYRLDGDAALIGDLTDEPVHIPLAALTAARGRIKKDKNRLLALPGGAVPKIDLKEQVRAGLAACQRGLTGALGVRSAARNFSLDCLATLADRLHGSKDNERWERVFPPGKRLWRGLASIYEYVEHYGSGGGLCRPLFAEFLTEAADALHSKALSELAERYAALGREWSALAEAALPRGVPLFRATRDAIDRRSESLHAAAPPDEIAAAWAELAALERQAGERFPLTDDQAAAMRAELQEHVRALHAGEVAAHEAMAACCQ
jgi:hypothetical protein